ncbi:MAG: peptidase M28, partial [Bacteroidota bacterium]
FHTAQDDVKHLSKKSLAHQGEYLIPMLDYYSNANLNTAQTTEDKVYFTIPFSFISYPFDWILPMVIIALALLLILTFIGIGKRILAVEEIGRGFIPFLGALIGAGLVIFLGWQIVLLIYPQYNDLLNGFTYNGHDYITGFILLTLTICFAFYQRYSGPKVTMSHYFAPLFIWIIINALIAIFLEGAGFLIIPVFSGLLMLASYVITQKSNWFLNVVLSIPALVLIAPFIQLFPIALGLKTLFGSAILTVLAFGLILPVFGSFNRKGIFSLLLFLAAIGFFAKANYESGYESGKAKPNSLVYILDADKNKASWATYDKNLDEWTKFYLGQNPKTNKNLTAKPLKSKYDSDFTYSADAPIKNLSKPTVEFLKDTIVRGNRYLKIRITPNRKVNRYDVFANENIVIRNFKANGLTLLGQKGSQYEREGNKLISYYVVDNLPLEIQFNVPAKSVLDLELMESSFDLMSNPLFPMAKRLTWMMPTPFVLNDAVIIKQKIKPSPRVMIPVDTINVNVIPGDTIPVGN